jgi:SAM-dependent methyltransferase
MKDYYQYNYKAYHEKTFHIDPSSFLNPLVKHLPKDALILDVACGSGRDLCWLKQRGFKVLGFERSKGLSALARKLAECRIIEGDFETYNFSNLNVDAIILVGALVHVSHEKLQSVFEHITSGLGENGKVLITLKQGEGTFADYNGRIFYLWQDRELKIIFTRLGFNIIDVRCNESKIRVNDIWISYILEKN